MYHEIHFIQIINKIWKKKLLILLISIIFSLLAYFLSLSLTKKYSTEIILNDPPFYLFDAYTSEITKIDNEYLNKLLSLEINYNLLDITNLEKFIDQSTEFDSFKIFLKSRNISVKEYFEINKIRIKKKENNKFLISIKHTNDLQGKLFLESYIKYTKDISVVANKIILKNLIRDKLDSVKKYLVFIEDKKNTDQKNIDLSFIYSQLNFLNKKIDDDSFDYIIINSIDSNQGIIDKDKESIAYSLMGLIFGLFLSLAFIFLRN
jgi:LPS O-antigen subunit length determinant protein (WzzB/FepE family)